jgi:Flp pilus assembly protein TadD
MKWLIRIALTPSMALLLWPEFPRYRAEWTLAEANGRLEGVLGGAVTGGAAVSSTQDALRLAQQAISGLPGDPRPIQTASVALLLLQRGAEAIALLEPAIAAGERPELTINLGRARGIRGDEKGATAAFLRTAWANPAAIATLPKSIREPLLEQVKERESQLRDGRLQQPPPL